MKIKIIILLFSIVLFTGCTLLQKESWDLMICETVMEDGAQCYDNSYVLKGYKTQYQCMEKGIAIASEQGFECGKNCRSGEYASISICDVVCNKNGCSN